MEIVFNSRTVPCFREAYRQTKLIQEHLECVVPDVKDDIGKIAWAEAQISLKSKDIGPESVVVGAAAEISVFYLTEGRESAACVNCTKAFEIEFEYGGAAEELEAQVSLLSQGVQARAVNPRKFALDLTVRAELYCYAREETIVSVSAENGGAGGLQLLCRQDEALLLSQICEKSFVVSEQLPLSVEGAEHIVSSHASLVSGACQMIGGKALIKGGAELSVAFETGESAAPVFVEQCVPFSVLIDSGEEEAELDSLLLQPTALYVNLSDAINGRGMLELELHATAQASFVRRAQIEWIADAYSTRCPVRSKQSALAVCRGSERRELACECAESVSLDTDGAVLLAQHAELLSFAVREDSAAASVAVSLLLRNADGSLDSVQKLLSAECALPAEDYTLESARIASLSVRAAADGLEISLGLCFVCLRSEKEELNCLTAVELEEDMACDPGSVPSLCAVRRQGRSLWELAKTYSSSTEAIVRLNEKYPMNTDFLLIPRL